MKFLFCNYNYLFGWGGNQHLVKRPDREKLWELYEKNQFDSYVYFIIKDYKILKIGSSCERNKNAGKNGRIGFLQRIPNVFGDKRNLISKNKLSRYDCKLFIYFIKDDKFGYKCQSVEYNFKHKYYLKYKKRPLYDIN